VSRLRVARLVATALALAGLLAPAAAAAELPLGSPDLDERRRSAQVASGVRWTVIAREGGPWRVNVLAIGGGELAGRVGGVLSNRRVLGLERPSTMARRTRAVAGINGGFFAVDGDPVGTLALQGRVVSEPVDGRSALLVPADPVGTPSIAPLGFEASVSAGGGERLVDGVDRRRGSIPACGGRGGDRPTERPNSALTCTDASELVLYSRLYGGVRPGTGVEALVRDGVVESVGRPATAAAPDGAWLLSGNGAAGRFLADRLVPGEPAEVDLALTAGAKSLELPAQALVTGGGPRLLTRGRTTVRARPEGFAPLEAPSFYGSFVASRQPRTLAGVKSDGTLLLVTVDGRGPGWSAGVTLAEAARVMRSLGARDALNLDGGGSTAMVVRGEVVNRPSDLSGERAVSDGIFVLP
jgi:Phosphodiester glycosidase